MAEAGGYKMRGRKLLYDQHRQRVQNAKSVVNSNAPPRPLKEDVAKTTLNYFDMIASFSRTTTPRTFTKSPYTIAKRPGRKSSDDLPAPEKDGPSTIVSKPLMLGKKSQYDVPAHVLKRYETMSFYDNVDLLRRLLRPVIYFDVEVRDVRPLGRLTVQLYTEACPQVVQEFVRVCTLWKPDRLKIVRLLQPVWVECELTLSDHNALSQPNIEHDMDAVDHGSGAGILSFPSRYVRGCKRKTLNYSISFEPIKVLNGKRIAFGKVRRGLRVLETIQEYGSVVGRPMKEIVVSNCGVLQ